MKCVATITDIEWVEVNSDHTPIETRQPKTPEEAKAIIEHYFSSSDTFDEDEERERTADVVKMYGITLLHEKNLLASSLEISITET